MSIVAHLEPEILVFDDGSTPPAALPDPAVLAVTLIRDSASPGCIVGRNRLVAAAQSDFVLLLDDDARLLSASAIDRALALLRADPSVAAVAFAPAEADGSRWPEGMQPSRATTPAVVPAFIGFAHLLRKSVFCSLSGYRESFEFYGEEKDFCLRLIDAGYKTVFLPDALVAHVIDRAARDQRRYLRMVSRNDCLNTLYNDPFERVAWVLPARFALYFRMRRGWKIKDPGGAWWLLRSLARQMPEVLKSRRPVSRATLARWRELQRVHVPYTGG
jgi:GT2 family glycosyltransferase